MTTQQKEDEQLTTYTPPHPNLYTYSDGSRLHFYLYPDANSSYEEISHQQAIAYLLLSSDHITPAGVELMRITAKILQNPPT